MHFSLATAPVGLGVLVAYFPLKIHGILGEFLQLLPRDFVADHAVRAPLVVVAVHADRAGRNPFRQLDGVTSLSR
ncbi:hypothetical protein [Adhaeretor mobilis]|uniref:Uncharacterized protein n=1 Tax=Adhaeretor mobilis TaxID=1930276 RepID=A0A517MQC1_9BACT|nr:hypothetical protein [Adhaeretor mobilis]QDS97074.1 hypothetical protein HG15A2_03330 [Adhaeretor mobilis]